MTDLRTALRHIPTSVVVVMAKDKNETPFGVTIGSFASVSLDPPMVSFNLSQSTTAFSVISQTKDIEIYFLSENQVEVSNHFATVHQPMVDLAESLMCLTGEIKQEISVGDSCIFVAEVKEIRLNENIEKPLLYFDRKYTTVL